ncbi:hypothetical protein [Mycolicibacterium brumae]|uniref:CopG family transcriptional regulator n=1 Tax=Mycolicibacterium brumae TaxID=85968 RepID=A0A2G5PC88_9MYCO|nr:hypothetical protein [Mycolicibacterium brumae]MCV7193130.1 hypothetical protein [Mycolicibacterium brumae]PIB75948.1 hypothetical protein CQY22_007850 [Mycolicibacterium brumae]RWA16568.1 hypothetical protein MBRU_07530 [Mycolicibacterium brumae DSM 44177]UWW09785.1 hypothetical protein L2Z93_002897 [Mycolicibacterium brumae]
MRTTVEITARQHEALSALARRRGVRGFSTLIQEALDDYLANVTPAEVEALLGLEGVLSDEDAARTEDTITELRSTWRAS